MEFTILIVDDQPIFRQGFRQLLEKEKDLRVIGEADDGQAAIDLIRRQSPNLVVMSIDMSNLDGVEATRQIRRAEKGGERVPIIALTANALREDRHNCLAAGMDDYLTKPFTRETLVKALHKWLGAKDPRQLPRPGTSAVTPAR